MRGAISFLAVLLAVINASGDMPQGERPDEVRLEFPLGLAMAPDGSFYVSERPGHRVRRVDLRAGVVTTVAGTGQPGFSGDGGPATAAQLRCPDSIAVDAAGNLYIADRCNERIRRVDAKTQIITTIAGTGERAASPDGPARERALQGPYYVNASSPGEIIFTDTDSNRVRRVDLRTGQMTTLAGNGQRDFSGDGGPALQAAMRRPHVALRARNGDIIIGDSFNQRIRRVDAKTGVIRTIAGRGEVGAADDGTPALEAAFAYFGQILELPDGDLLFTEWVNGRVLRLDAETGQLRVVAGTVDPQAPAGDGHPPQATKLGRAAGMALDAQGRILVVAAAAGAVRRIDLSKGIVETVAGAPSPP